MNILNSVLLASIRFAFVGVLKAALFVYIWSRPASPFVGTALQSDSRTGVVVSTAAQDAGITPLSLERDAFSS
jgi:hypothetical protein